MKSKDRSWRLNFQHALMDWLHLGCAVLSESNGSDEFAGLPLTSLGTQFVTPLGHLPLGAASASIPPEMRPGLGSHSFGQHACDPIHYRLGCDYNLGVRVLNAFGAHLIPRMDLRHCPMALLLCRRRALKSVDFI